MHPLVPRMITAARASGGGGWMRANCLACPERAGKNDTKQSFSVNAKSGYYRCLRCGLKGFVEGAERRFSEKALDDSARKAEQGDEECRKLPDNFYQLDVEPALSSRFAQVARDYLDKRGITAQKRLRTGIGAVLIPPGRFYGRIICPLRGTYGELVGYVGRAWYEGADRPYLYPQGMHRGELLYGVEHVHKETDDPLVIVEGFFDALYLSDGGASGAVLGLPSEQQLDILAEAQRPVVFALDGDAWQKAYACAQRLRAATAAQGRIGRFGALRLPAGLDPDELPPQEVFDAARDAWRH